VCWKYQQKAILRDFPLRQTDLIVAVAGFNGKTPTKTALFEKGKGQVTYLPFREKIV
jgi:hypothetical protein